MPGETVKLQVELVEKDAEARLKALDKLAKEMGNRKITLNFDEASLARWKTATDGMTNAQLSAYAKILTAAEKTTQVEIAAANRVQTEVVKAEAKKAVAAEKTTQVATSSAAKIEAANIKAEASAKRHAKAVENIGDAFSSLTSRFTAANLASAAITRGITLLRNALREAVTEMKEMDKELTTIKMVTGASDSDISALRQQAFAGARETGRTTSDYLSAAERFARAGYRENIQDLTKLSLVTQNVGGVTEDVASKFILAADAAWQMGGSTERLWSMLDGVTSIADQNATDIGKIAEAYTVAGSAFANAGESERTFAALIGTTTAATQRSGSEMARGLQTILFRVRQVKGELDDGEIINAEDISNAAKALDSVGISVLNDANELKSFSQIMGELSEKWETLNTKQKAYLQNALAGNRRGNVLFSLMDNWGVFEKQLSQFDEASGTALQKNEVYLDSWQAATNELKNSWAELISTVTDGGQVFVELANAANYLVQGINELHKNSTNTKAAENLLSSWDKLVKDWKQLRAEDNMPGPKDWTRWQDYADVLLNFVFGVTDAEEAQSEMTEEQKALSEATVQVIKTYNEEAEAVDALSEAFSKANANIKDAADKMKDEKDSSIKSAADIYKAMQEAAEKGYYGSNAYKEGAKLFFGTSDKDAIGQIAQDALDAYFDAISKGDYSNAAASLWGSFADESGDIVDKATGEVIASMHDAGDSYEWAFNKGNKSISEFLASMESATGVGADFWASMIQSLGMYSDEMDKWMQENIEEPEPELTIKADTDQAQSAIENINKMLDGIKDKTVRVNIIQSISGSSVSDATQTVHQAATEQAIKEGGANSYMWSGYASSKGIQQRAGGKRDNYSGIALVNDEFPADGSKPELIISKSQGRAYIANGGKPALVNLRSDDVVLTASETKSAFGVPGFPIGKNTPVLIETPSLKDGDMSSFLKITTPKNPNDSGSGGGGGGSSKTDPSDSWATLKKLVDYLLDKGEEDLKEQLKVLDDQLAELEAERKAQEESNKLQEKQEAVQNALLDLEKAQAERTVRYYNEETKQWEWMADQGAVQSAQEAYDKAMESLNEYLSDQDYEAKKAEIQASKNELQSQFDAYEESWKAIVDAIEAPSGDVKAILDEIRKNGTSTMMAQSSGIADLLNQLRDGLVSIGYGFGLGNINANTSGSKTTKSTVFDSGGFAFGPGYMRKGAGAEMVIGPEITRDILNPVKNARFSEFTESLKYLVGGGGSPSFKGSSSITNNNGGNYYINGVQVGQNLAQRPFAEVMRTITIHANESK